MTSTFAVCAVTCFANLQLEKVRLDSEAAQRRMEAEAAQSRVAVAQAESMYKSERAQWVTSLDAQKFEVCAVGISPSLNLMLDVVLVQPVGLLLMNVRQVLEFVPLGMGH